MIRFACPGCSATYTVGDEKGGKSGKCPKCQAQFTIPMPDASAQAAAPSRPIPPPASSAIEIAPCPGCQAKLSVERGDLESDVECPYCKNVFKAKMPGGASTASSRRPARQDDDLDVVPKGRSVRDEDDEERPSRRRRDGDDDDDERPSRRRRPVADDEDEGEPRRRRKRRSRGDQEPHRGGMILTFGILSLFCCPIIFGLIAITQANTDLAKMRAGTMDESGIGLTNTGRILGIVGLVLGAIVAIVRVVLTAAG